MTGAVIGVELGAGAHRALSVDGRGRVVAVYRRAAYLRLPAGLVALTTPDVWRGPLHVRCSIRPELLAPGDPIVVVAGSGLRIGRSAVDLGGCRIWRGGLPDAAALGAAATAGLAADVLAEAPRPGLDRPAYATRRDVALHRLAHRDLAGVARAIGGLGPGLTPSGDDTLAGILLVARVLGGPGVEDVLVEVAGTVRTTSVARAFLEWAARGQCVEPAHDLLTALAAADGARASGHLAALVGVGHTSGADLAYGLRLGLHLGLHLELGVRLGGGLGVGRFRPPDPCVARGKDPLLTVARPCNAGAR